MQIRDLFLIVLRVYGISILLFTAFPMLISNLAFFSNPYGMKGAELIIYLLGTVILPFIVSIVLIFWTSWVINLLKLDKGFQSTEVLLNSTSQQQTLQLAIILLGGFLIVKNITTTIAHVVEAFRISLIGFENSTYHNFWQSGLSVFIGALLIANREALTKWLMPKSEEQKR